MFSRVFSYCYKFALIFTFVNGFSNPIWLQSWIHGSKLVREGNTLKGISFLEEAHASSSNDSNTSVSCFMKSRVCNDLAFAYESNSNFKKALSLYMPVVTNKVLRATPTEIVALRGVIRCKKALNQNYEEFSCRLEELCPSLPSMYLCDNLLILIPFTDKLQRGIDSVFNGLNAVLPSISKDELAPYMLKTVTEAVIVDLSALVTSNSLKEVHALVRKNSVPLLYPDSKNSKKAVFHKTILDDSCKVAISCWMKGNMLIMDYATSNNVDLLKQANDSLTQALSLVKGRYIELETRLLLELAICNKALGNFNTYTNMIAQSSRTDSFGATRSTFTAICLLLEDAVRTKSFTVLRKSVRRAERLYPEFPKIIGMFGDCLIVESCKDGIENIPKLLSASTNSSYKIPDGIVLSSSSSVLIWEKFEAQLSAMPGVKLLIKSWQSVNAVFNIFGSKQLDTPRSKGLLGLFIGDESKSDDI